jgi:hypothetical protein
MPRGLDHIVHAVRDLDAAAELYARLGFRVGARNRHPWGTHNRIVQMPGFYVELLTVAEPDKIGDDVMSRHFGGFHRDFLAGGEGLSMLLLGSVDAVADAKALHASGIAASDAVRFERDGARADGTVVKLAFTLAFARDARAPRAGFAVCQHHNPQNFWNLAFHDHANSACGVAGVVLVADNPSDHHIFLSAFVGERALQATSSGVRIATPRGDIRLMDAAAFRDHFGGEPPDVSAGARLAAVRLAVRDLHAARAALKAGGIAAAERMGRLVVAAAQARSATLVLEPAGAAG